MDSIQRHAGYWWVPNHQNKMITGTLYIEEDGNAYLETIGLLDEDFIHKTYYDVIWGMTSNAKPVSLFRCGLSVSRNTACFFSTGKYSASVVAVGKHISSLNETDNYNVCVDIEELNYWHRPSLIHLDNQFDHVDFDDEDASDFIDGTQSVKTWEVLYGVPMSDIYFNEHQFTIPYRYIKYVNSRIIKTQRLKSGILRVYFHDDAPVFNEILSPHQLLPEGEVRLDPKRNQQPRV